MLKWPRRRPAAAEGRLSEVRQVAQRSFVELQAAWDRADLAQLEACTTAPLMADLREQLARRGGADNRTEIVGLQARLLALDDLQEAQLASVEFSGWVREAADAQAAPFRELWFLADVKGAGLGWRLAGVQALG